MKVADVDLSKESAQVQEFADNVRSLINGGAVEFEVVFAPAWELPNAPKETKIVLAINGSSYRLYISYEQTWKYVELI
jgi:hypothetical protein